MIVIVETATGPSQSSLGWRLWRFCWWKEVVACAMTAITDASSNGRSSA
jgi:hypothetical protein